MEQEITVEPVKQELPQIQLKITRQGKILVFKDKETGKRWSSQLNYIRSLCFGKRNFYYAGEYKPNPAHRPPKNKIVTPL